jgi:hypothetical protein
LLFRAACLLPFALASAAPAEAEDPFTPFMAQSVCLDAQDAPRPGLLPFEAECERSRP